MKLKIASKAGRGFAEIYTAREHVANRPAVYRLLEGDSKFYLEVCYGDERALLPLGQSFARAAAIFERFRQGTVTPCTAKDVLSDLLFRLEK